MTDKIQEELEKEVYEYIKKNMKTRKYDRIYTLKQVEKTIKVTKQAMIKEFEKMIDELMHVYPNENAGFYIDVEELKQKLGELK